MKACLYQFNPAFGKKDENLKKVLSAVKDADMDILVLPEFFATGYQFVSKDEVAVLSEQIPRGYTTGCLSELSRKKGFYIVAGIPERDGDNFFNSAVLTGPDGFIGVYRKTHLFFDAMPVRCLENRVFAITANRIGEESRKDGQPLRFIGQSLIVSPEGKVLISAPEDDEALLIAEIDLETAKNKSLNSLNNIFDDRRPEMYWNLTGRKT